MAEPTSLAAPQHGIDQRLAKGARSRATIARHAADVASVEGLNGVSIGRLATDLGISKSGIATLFGTKEALQVAAIKSAREVFVERIIAPSMSEPSGLPRLRSLLDRWFRYLIEPSFHGGCLRVATLNEFASKPGPVRDAIAEDHTDWLSFLAKEVHRAQEQGHLSGRAPEAVAFELEAVMSAANTAQQMGEPEGIATARTIVDNLLV